jgi:GTP cyclohydrolase I
MNENRKNFIDFINETIRNNAVSQDPIQRACQDLLMAISSELGLDLSDENFFDTPERMSRMYREILSGLHNTDHQVEEILKSAFPSTNDQLVLVRDIEAFSLCPHHFLPVHYKIHVAYIPSEKVIGLSKLARLVNVLAKRPVLQEQFVEDVSSSLMKIEGCLGAACIAEGTHYCMVMRGVRQSQSRTITSSLKGVFLEDASARQELMQLIGNC